MTQQKNLPLKKAKAPPKPAPGKPKPKRVTSKGGPGVFHPRVQTPLGSGASDEPSSSTNPVLFKLFGDKLGKGDRRKKEIVEAAIECIGTVGVANTSYESIGKRLGIGRAHVAYHFPDFEKLMEMVIQYRTDTAQSIVVDLVEAAQTWQDAVRAYVDGPFFWIERHPNQASVLMLLYYYGSYEPKYRTLHTQIRKTGLARIEAILTPVIRKRFSSPTRYRKEANELARAIQALITGNVVNWITCESEVSLAQLREQTYRKSIDLVEAALAP